MAGHPPPVVHHAIDRFAYFQGILHIAGWVHAPSADIVCLDLLLPDGRAHRIGIPGPAPPGAAPQPVPFQHAFQLQAPIAEVLKAMLRIGFSDHAPIRIADLNHLGGDPAHELIGRFHRMILGAPDGHLLEVGSRARSGVTRSHLVPPGWAYSGLDVIAGPNVDVLGDAHRLSSIYPARHFDAVMSFSVLEHLLMPWKFVIELNRVLKPGACGLFTTHQCWPLHDQPWDFWRFSDKAWVGLLNAATGFEIIDAQMGEPCHVVAAKCHPAVAFGPAPEGRLASFVLFRKTGETTLDWPVELDAITTTLYPPTTTDIHRAAP